MEEAGARAGCASYVCAGDVWTGAFSQVLRNLYVVEGKIGQLSVNAGSSWLCETSVVLMCISEFHFVPCVLKSES